MACTTVQFSPEARDARAAMKLHPRETPDDVIGRVLEDFERLDRATLRTTTTARKEIASGRSMGHEKLREKMGL